MISYVEAKHVLSKLSKETKTKVTIKEIKEAAREARKFRKPYLLLKLTSIEESSTKSFEKRTQLSLESFTENTVSQFLSQLWIGRIATHG